MSSQTTNIDDLFQSAQNDGAISPASAQAFNVIDIGNQIQTAMGIPVDQVSASSVLLVQGLIDDSGSIRFAGNADVVREGQNEVKKALIATKQKDGILMGIRYLNDGVLAAFNPLDQTPDLDTHNYNPSGGTPLLRETLATLATVVAKAQEFQDNGVPVKSVTYIFSDGADTDGGVSTRQIASVVTDMFRSEQHIVCGIGVDDTVYDSAGHVLQQGTNFKKVFGDMGIPDNFIIDIKCPPQPGESEDQRKARLRSMVRKAFNTVSQSAVRASQAANNPAAWSQTAMGGFAANP